jgi:hypothetical protein
VQVTEEDSKGGMDEEGSERERERDEREVVWTSREVL